MDVAVIKMLHKRAGKSDSSSIIVSKNIRNAFFGLANICDIFNSYVVNLLPYTPKLRRLALIESIEVIQLYSLLFQVRLYQDVKGNAFVGLATSEVNSEHYYIAINKNRHITLTIDDAHKLWNDLVKHLRNQKFTINYQDKSSAVFYYPHSIVSETIGIGEDH